MGFGPCCGDRSCDLRKIILASGSKARQKLLKQMGLKFTVSRSSVIECHALRGSASRLVMKNAMDKARDVAKRCRSGIVIGADTLVLVGNKVIGKPRNLKDAHRTLKLLSRKPQLVYSGLALIDIDSNKRYLDYEKTKVYMYKLSDGDIRNYFKKTSPLDKAGSFDIQGMGGIFIDRIEGCFYNVVGLPLAKLAVMLRRAGVDLFE